MDGTVLLIEDEEEIAELLRLVFEKEGEVKFRPRVQHPGNRAFGMVRKTVAETQRELAILGLRIAIRSASIWDRGS